MSTSLDLTDDLIKKLDGDFVSLSQKLLGVQDDIQYRALTGTGGFNDPKLSGQTEKVVSGARATIGVVWILVDLVGKRITAVKAKRATVKSGFLSNISGAAKELEDQLKLHNLGLTDDVLKQCPQSIKDQLLSQQQNATSVEVVLVVGAQQLNDAAKAIISVSDCQEKLKQQIADTEGTLNQVLPLVTKIAGAAGLAHRSALAALATMKASLDHDPLGARQSYDKVVEPHILAINQALDQVQKAKEKAYAELGDAKVLMQRLEDRQPSPVRTPELRDWLVKLAARIDQEEWATASQGLEDWIKEASGVLKVPPPSSQSPSQPAHPQPGHQQPPAPARNQPAPPAVHHNPPPPPVRQIPTSADYKKYEPKEKSNLEKLLDGELAASSTPTPVPVEKPVDAAVEQLVSAQTQPSKTPAESQGPNHALDALVNGQSRPAQGTQTPSTTTSPNAALDDLLSGRSKPTPTPGQPASTVTPPPSSTSPNAALDDLLNGRTKPPATTGSASSNPGQTPGQTPGHNPPPASTGSSTGSSLADLIDGKKTTPTATTPPVAATVKPAAAPAPVSHPVTTEQQDPSKLADLFGEKKKPAATPAPTNAKTTGEPSQAEKDAAARKALENLLKG